MKYSVTTLENRHGVKVTKMQFATFESLARFFAEELIGSSLMEGSASKVIGTTLLIWDRN